MRIRHEDGEARRAQERFGISDQDDVVGSDQFDHPIGSPLRMPPCERTVARALALRKPLPHGSLARGARLVY